MDVVENTMHCLGYKNQGALDLTTYVVKITMYCIAKTTATLGCNNQGKLYLTMHVVKIAI